MATVSPWNDARVELLTKLWESGKSSTYIAQELSKDGINFSRSAIAGKVSRLSLTRRPGAIKSASGTVKRRRVNGSKPKFTSSSRPRPKAPTMRPHHVEDEVRVPNPKNQVGLLLTKDFHCRAIVGYEGGLKEKAICCGEVTPWIVSQNGIRRRSSWCNYHRKLFLSPPKPR